MKRMLLSSCLAFALFPWTSHALLGGHLVQDVVMNDHARLEVVISASHFNRLCVEGEGIAQVFANGDIVIEQDEVQGQIFIKPIQKEMTQPLYISLVTEKGTTQDLTLKPTQKTPQAIMLKKEKTVSSKSSSKDKYASVMKTALQAALEGKSLEGFISVNSKPLRTFEGLTLTSFQLFQGRTLNCEVYDLQNDSSTSKKVNEDTFSTEGVKAFVVTDVQIPPNKSVRMVILSQKDTLHTENMETLDAS